MTTSRHHYQRQMGDRESSSLLRLSEWVPPGSAVLELGPASGYFTRHLKETLGCTVDAVEIDAAMAEQARRWCRRIVVGSLESIDLAACLGSSLYDVIVAADVIEHLREPQLLLRQLRRLLSAEGRLLVSIPNVAYAGLVASLLEGKFEYRDEGLLDRTHLRFFTRESLTAMLQEEGYYSWAWQAVERPLGESEFRTRLEEFSPSFVSTLLQSPYALCYQWLVMAGLYPSSEPSEDPQTCRVDRFPVRVFWAARGQEYDYARSSVSWGAVGAPRQTLSFPLPAIDAVRLRLADRPSYVHLFSVRVIDSRSAELWRWDWRDKSAKLSSAFDGMALQDAGGHVLALLHGNESWLQLALPPLAAESMLEVEIGWPLSADFLIARSSWEAAVTPLQEKLHSTEALVAERDALLDQRLDQIKERERLIVERDTLLELRTTQMEQREQLIVERDSLLELRTTQMEQLEQLIVERDALLQQCQQRQALQEATLLEYGKRIADLETLRGWLRQPLKWIHRSN